MKYKTSILGSYSRQLGAMALLMSLIILVLITFVSLMVANTVSMEQKISANEFRSRIAFEAAEAGLNAAYTYLDKSNGGADRNNTLPDDVADELIFEADGSVVVGDPDGNEQNWKVISVNGVDVSRVTVAMTSNSDLTQVTVRSVGVSIDGGAQRTIEQTIAVLDPIPNVPKNPFTGRGTVTVQGSATVHNPEGNSTVWTGGDFDIGSSAGAYTATVKEVHPNYDVCLGGAHPCSDYPLLEGCRPGVDIPDTNFVKCDVHIRTRADIEHGDIQEEYEDLANLSPDEFFKNFFGMTKNEYRRRMVTHFVDGADFDNDWDDATNPGVNGVTASVVWVTGAVDAGGVVVGCDGGSPNAKNDAFDENCEADGGDLDPAIIIIDGDFEINGGYYFGLVYVTGSVTTAGGPEFQGAIIVEDPAQQTNVTGSLDIWYDSGILRMLADDGPFASSSGSWKDF